MQSAGDERYRKEKTPKERSDPEHAVNPSRCEPRLPKPASDRPGASDVIPEHDIDILLHFSRFAQDENWRENEAIPGGPQELLRSPSDPLGCGRPPFVLKSPPVFEKRRLWQIVGSPDLTGITGKKNLALSEGTATMPRQDGLRERMDIFPFSRENPQAAQGKCTAFRVDGNLCLPRTMLAISETRKSMLLEVIP